MKARHLTRKQAVAGYTLVELLAALVILAVLIALLVGGIGTAQKHLDLSRCSHHLRQLQTAFHAYVSDHDGVLPDKSPRRLYPYVAIPDGDVHQDTAFTCPAIQRTENAAVGPYHRTMSINIYATTEKITDPYRITRIQTPSQMLLFTEGKVISDTVSPTGRRGKTYFSTTRLEDLDKLLKPHQELQNAVFVDGSVRRVNDEEFYQGGRWNTYFWRGYEK